MSDAGESGDSGTTEDSPDRNEEGLYGGNSMAEIAGAGGATDGESETSEAGTLSSSEQVYIAFRETVEPGLFDAGFDLLPAKSEAVENPRTGEPFVDQQLRTHITSGAAFASRVNRALTRLDPGAALDDAELLQTMSLYASHDLHKTEISQRRRREWRQRRPDEDKDITRAEVKYYTEKLRLRQLETPDGTPIDLDVDDWWASAVAAEKESGRHDQVVSRDFTQLKDWVRLMDAAASLSKPHDVTRLRGRINEISEEVSLHFHRLDDTKGITTNVLNSVVADRFTDDEGRELLVYFQNGALYLTDCQTAKGFDQVAIPDEQISAALADDLVDEIRESNPVTQGTTSLGSLLDDTTFRFGYYKISDPAYIFAELPAIYGAVRDELIESANRDPSVYSVYQDAVKAAVAAGTVDDLPASYVKGELLGIYLSTVYYNLLFDNGLTSGTKTERKIRSLRDIAVALNLEDAVEAVIDVHDDTEEGGVELHLSESQADLVAQHIDEDTGTLTSDAIGVTFGKGKKVGPMVLALAYLQGDTEDGTPRSELPFETIIAEAHEQVMAYYDTWPSHWDEAVDEPSDATVEEKQATFEQSLLGTIEEALPYYIARYLSVDGEILPQPDVSKIEAYDRQSQPQICLTCDDQLIGATSFDAFESNESVIGRSMTYTHLKKVGPGESDPTTAICGVCELEFVLRNVEHGTDTDTNALYLLTAPDYFHSPVDARLQDWLHGELNRRGAYAYYAAAREIMGEDVSGRNAVVKEAIAAIIGEGDEIEAILNYDSQYADDGALGLFRLDPPLRNNGDQVNRKSRWTVAVAFAHIFGWFTGSRVILADSPFPAAEFEHTTAAVTCEGVPAGVADHLPQSSSVSMLWDIEGGDGWDSHDIWRASTADDASAATAEAEDLDTAAATAGLADLPDAIVPDGLLDPSMLYLSTDLGVSVYRLAALLYVTNRTHGNDMQRLTTVLNQLDEPFPGATAVLRQADDAPLEDYTALFGAAVLDTLTHPTMEDSISRLAAAGFEVIHPEKGEGFDASNHDYERLFRDAADALDATLVSQAGREELKDVVAGVVMESGARNRDEYDDPNYLLDDAEDFADIFVDEVLHGICDGEFYVFRRQEQSLASGYNAAIRRHQQRWYDQFDGDDDSEPSHDDNDDATGEQASLQEQVDDN